MAAGEFHITVRHVAARQFAAQAVEFVMVEIVDACGEEQGKRDLFGQCAAESGAARHHAGDAAILARPTERQARAAA